MVAAHQAGTQQAGAGGPVKTGPGAGVGPGDDHVAHARSVIAAHQAQAAPSAGSKSGQPKKS